MSDLHSSEALSIQSKFDFYFVGLIFIVLNFVIQSGSFGVSIIVDICELLSWILLLIAGIVALTRLEFLPIIHIKIAHKNSLSSRLQQVQMHISAYSQVRISDGESVEGYIKKHKDRIEELESEIDNLNNKKIGRKYSIQKYTFIAGMILLVISRGFSPSQDLIHRIVSSSNIKNNESISTIHTEIIEPIVEQGVLIDEN